MSLGFTRFTAILCSRGGVSCVTIVVSKLLFPSENFNTGNLQLMKCRHMTCMLKFSSLWLQNYLVSTILISDLIFIPSKPLTICSLYGLPRILANQWIFTNLNDYFHKKEHLPLHTSTQTAPGPFPLK